MSDHEKHTPLPYSYDSQLKQIRAPKGYMGSTGLTIATICDNPGMPIGQPQANCDFIIRACNSHYGLLEATKLAEVELGLYELQYPNNKTTTITLQKLQEAIAKAEAK